MNDLNRAYESIHQRKLDFLKGADNDILLFNTALFSIQQPGRRVGNTTRSADLAIQFLFHKKELRLSWLILDKNDVRHAKHLFHVINRRLRLEHDPYEQYLKFSNRSIKFINAT